jgi:hypothetical protein
MGCVRNPFLLRTTEITRFSNFKINGSQTNASYVILQNQRLYTMCSFFYAEGWVVRAVAVNIIICWEVIWGQLYRRFGQSLSKFLPNYTAWRPIRRRFFFRLMYILHTRTQPWATAVTCTCYSKSHAVTHLVYFYFWPQFSLCLSVSLSLGLAGTKLRFCYAPIIKPVPIITHHGVFCMALPVHIANEENHHWILGYTRNTIYL